MRSAVDKDLTLRYSYKLNQTENSFFEVSLIAVKH